jgi:protein TonB
MTRRYFDTLIVSAGKKRERKRALTLPVSIAIHAVVLVAVVVLPLLSYGDLPDPVMSGAVRAFLVEAAPAPPPPPPPPPPPAAAAAPRVERPRTPAPAVVPTEAPKFTAPVEIPAEVPSADVADLGAGVPGGEPGGVEGGVVGGQEGGVVGGTIGGVPGGELGGVVGGVPGGVPEPEPEVPKGPVRVGGQIKPPKKVRSAEPVYPAMAREARVQGVVILEATISASGEVTNVKVLRGNPLLDKAAVDAVREWAYSPTMLNGTAVPVIMTVTVKFRLPS